MTNPYAAPKVNSFDRPYDTTHPDWKWMAAMGYGFCVVCMFGIIGKTNPPGSSVLGFGHGLIRAPYFLGDTVFTVAIPFLSLLPAALVSLAFRYAYRTFNHSESKTLLNFVMLFVAVLVAILNACLYRGD